MKSPSRVKVFIVFGTRPEAIKMAPVVEALRRHPGFEPRVVVTAQHREMLDQVLKIFRIRPHHDLRVMEAGQTLEHITSTVLTRLGPLLEKEKPAMVLVHGDTTTSFAASLSAFYHRVAVGHVEAGLRSYDFAHPFPEEANRVLTDQLCALHFAPTQTSRRNLLRAGIGPKSIFITGNTVIDALRSALKKPYTPPAAIQRLLNRPEKLILVTAHRRENFGAPLRSVFLALRSVADRRPDVHFVYPVHLNPNVQGPARKILGGHPRITLIEPVDYLTLAHLMKKAELVVTDSGGIQEEAPALGKPVLVLRNVTERPEAVKAGTVRIVGTDERRVRSEILKLLEDGTHYGRMAHAVNPYGDGQAAERTVSAMAYYFGLTKRRPVPFRPAAG